MSAKTVFISYSHDSPEHSDRVLQFSNALRNSGIDAELDRYHMRPPKGWPHWCEEQLRPENSAFVLMVCTETYLKRVQDRVPADEGRGVFWEGTIIYDYLYDEKGNTRFVPILFADGDPDFIPAPIRNHTRYRVKAFDLTDAGYQDLYRELTSQPLVTKPPLGQIVELGHGLAETALPLEARPVKTNFPIIDTSRIIKYAPVELIGRNDELKFLSDAWDQAVQAKEKSPHILTFVALGGEGKTSLVAKWAADLAYRDWPGCDAAFAWSFYSQGTSEKTQASSDTFLAEALRFFGDEETATSAKSAFDKGKRLAELVGERRALLILDGLEPLQYPPGPPMDGKLKDDGISALLKSLAVVNHRFCIVTTRYSIPDLKAFWQTTAPEIKLASLSREAGVDLLQKLGVKGSLLRNIPFNYGKEKVNEFEKLVEDVKGHALTLNLLGTYLCDAHGGDIRKRDLVKLEEADAEEQSGHAFRVMDAYVRSFETQDEKAKRALTILRLLGLFDRPVTADCFRALLDSPAIPNLTELLVGINDAQRNLALSRLEDAKLLTVNRDTVGTLISLDAHPLIREYFAKQLREKKPESWRGAHRRLYEYLCETTKEGDEPTLEDLQPLYQAVAHACQAGLQQEAADEIYYGRIAQREKAYAVKRLGAFGSDLGAVACFFEAPWSRVSRALTQADQGWLLNQAAFRLRALGRLTEALEPMRAGVAFALKLEDWRNAAVGTREVSLLDASLGDLISAERDAEQSVVYADRSADPFEREVERCAHAHALHQAGRWADAEARFHEAETLKANSRPNHPLLSSLQGFLYCDLLLTEAERAAWQTTLLLETRNSKRETAVASCRAVSERAAQTLKWFEQAKVDLLSIALDHLTLGRAALYISILDPPPIGNRQLAIKNPNAAVDSLRRASIQQYIPLGLLTRAWLRFLESDADGALSDLVEAWEIAERGPMRLFMADIHLYRARLFHAVKPYPWNKNPDGTERGQKDDLAAARKLIEQCGYGRRKEELEDAEEAAKNWD